MIVGVQDGRGAGNLVAVSGDGEMSTESRPAAHGVNITSGTVNAVSGTLVGALTGRRGLWVQNQSVNAIWLRFAVGLATNADWMVPAGGEFRAESFAYEGPIQAIAAAAPSIVLVLQMA